MLGLAGQRAVSAAGIQCWWLPGHRDGCKDIYILERIAESNYWLHFRLIKPLPKRPLEAWFSAWRAVRKVTQGLETQGRGQGSSGA
jgi:hypothetical protein